jgi:hypothetical protein
MQELSFHGSLRQTGNHRHNFRHRAHRIRMRCWRSGRMRSRSSMRRGRGKKVICRSNKRARKLRATIHCDEQLL